MGMPAPASFSGDLRVAIERLREAISDWMFREVGVRWPASQIVADSWYNGMTIKWEKRFSKGLQMLVHYTWSKFLDTVSNGSSNLDWLSSSSGRNLQNLWNMRQEKSLSSNDVAHRFVATFVYQLPFGRGRQFANHLNPWVEGVIGGWELGGLFTLQASQPMQITQNGGTLWNGTQRPNLVGDPSMPGSVEDRLSMYLNPAAFTKPPADVFGNAPRTMSYRAPGLKNADVALLKNLRLTERKALQFRLEAFNVTNTPNFGVPSTRVGDAGFVGRCLDGGRLLRPDQRARGGRIGLWPGRGGRAGVRRRGRRRGGDEVTLMRRVNDRCHRVHRRARNRRLADPDLHPLVRGDFNRVHA